MFTVRESIADSLSQLNVSMMYRVEGDKLHLSYIGFAIFCQILLVTEDVHDLSHKIFNVSAT